MAAKQLAFEEEARGKLLVGVEKLARAVKAGLKASRQEPRGPLPSPDTPDSKPPQRKEG